MRPLLPALRAPLAGCLPLALTLTLAALSLAAPALAAPALAAPALAAPAPLRQEPPTPPQVDETPSDAAALGFLRGFADERMLHLPAQGVHELEGVAKVLMTSAVGIQERLTYTVAAHFDTGQMHVDPVGRLPDLAPRWRTVADLAAANILETQTPLSDIASAYVVRLSRDGDQVRLSFQPRDRKNAYRLSLWFQQDGTLVRKQEAQVLAEGHPPEVTDTTFVLKKHNGRAYIVETARVMRNQTCKARYEYRSQDGVLVLHKLFLDGVMDVNPETGEPFRQPITVEVEYEVTTSSQHH